MRKNEYKIQHMRLLIPAPPTLVCAMVYNITEMFWTAMIWIEFLDMP